MIVNNDVVSACLRSSLQVLFAEAYYEIKKKDGESNEGAMAD